MQIHSSNIQLSSTRQYVEQLRRRESLRAWVGNSPPSTDSERPDASSVGVSLSQDVVLTREEWSLEARTGVLARQAGLGSGSPVVWQGTPAGSATTARLNRPAEAASKKAKESEETDPLAGGDAPTQDLRVWMLLMEKMLGVKVRLQGSVEGEAAGAEECTAASQPSGAEEPSQRQGWGLAYERQDTYFEAENTSFVAAGVIKTADGQEVQFSLSVEMRREVLLEHQISVRAGDAVDPLVINFDGTAAQLASGRFDFDLNADGSLEQVAGTGAGNAYLALDVNQDGKINNGSELFGPTTGAGFEELARYDQDNNQWIDAGDAVFDQLRLWQGGNSSLQTLQEKQVGAIYLGHAETPFDITTVDNELQGQVASSGVFVREDGTVGSVQQVNLSI